MSCHRFLLKVAAFWSVVVLALASVAFANDIPRSSAVPAGSKEVVQTDHGQFFWRSAPVGNTAQLLTLSCRLCYGLDASGGDVPLVSVLRDTLGDSDPDNDRVLYAWLLSAPHINVGQKILSAVPFFFWRVGSDSEQSEARHHAPQFDISAPERPMLNGFTRTLVQYTALDPLALWTRAASRSYQANAADNQRFQLEETTSLLEQAPAGDDPDSLTASQLKTALARLELRKNLLGGLVNNRQAERFAEESVFERERVRSRNWELLRQCAEKTGLVFEPVDLGGAQGQYAMLWYPRDARAPARSSNVRPIYKLLNIQDPWTDNRLRQWEGLTFTRAVDDSGRLLPEDSVGTGQLRLIPLGLYSLTYPKMPLLLIDFRDHMHVRLREMTQRSINQITSGIVGLSRITNWYYYAGAMLYDFVQGRHGSAVNQSARLDCYSQFRVRLAIDRSLNPDLYRELTRRAESLTVSPLGNFTSHAAQVARARYSVLLANISRPDSPLIARLNRDRRAELARFGQSFGSSMAHEAAHLSTFGLYTQRVPKDRLDLAVLNQERRFAFHLAYLEGVIQNGTAPEVASSSLQIQNSLAALAGLIQNIQSPAMRGRALATVSRVAELSRDTGIQAGCRETLTAFIRHPARKTETAVRAGNAPGTASPSSVVRTELSDLQ